MLFKKEVSSGAAAEGQGRPRSAAGLSMLASGCRFQGRVCLHGDARVGGEVEGTIVSSALLIIEQTSIIRGDINGTNVLVNGRVEGNVMASDVLRLSPSCVVTGDLCAKRLIIEDGACVEGRISRLDPSDAAKVRSLPIGASGEARKPQNSGRTEAPVGASRAGQTG